MSILEGGIGGLEAGLVGEAAEEEEEGKSKPEDISATLTDEHAEVTRQSVLLPSKGK